MGDNIWSCYLDGNNGSPAPLFGQALIQTWWGWGGGSTFPDLQHSGNMFIVTVVLENMHTIKTIEYFCGGADQEHKMWNVLALSGIG